MTIDLLCVGGGDLAWPLGETHAVPADAAGLAEATRRIADATRADALLFWNPRLGDPRPADIERAAALPGDLWHAGLRLGTGGHPGLIDFVAPVWMLNRDPDDDIVATSWRISLDACLVRTDVVRQLGTVTPGYASLAGAALEMGRRYWRRGVLMRHVPWIVDANATAQPPPPLSDELLFIKHGWERKWITWVMARAAATGYASPAALLQAWTAVRGIPAHPARPPIDRLVDGATPQATITAVVPTLDRYPFLRTVLRQLGEQTLRPHQVVVVDQSDDYDPTVAGEFPGLPLTVVRQEKAGQCTSRNRAIDMATGEYLLFIDDDDEIPADLLARHVAALRALRADACSGRADEVGVPIIPESDRFVHLSDGFTTNNTLVRRDVLARSGMFDLAYDRRPRADNDLGIRAYLSGALLVTDYRIGVLHHRAPKGGLRTHGVRVQTFASRQKTVTHRHLPNASELYQARRYFTERQLRETMWLRGAETLIAKGPVTRRVAKAGYALALLPDTVEKMRATLAEAEGLLTQFPQIPSLQSHAP